MTPSVKWERRPNALWHAMTPRGEISVAHRNFRNVGHCWEVRFPDGKTFRAESAVAGMEYAEAWLARQDEGK